MSKKAGKFHSQDILYEFPYHYLPQLDQKEIPRLYRYLSWGFDYLTYMSFVVDQIKSIAPKSLLDIGCGDGRLIHWVKTAVPQVSGIDLSERAIAFARVFNPEVMFHCADIVTLSGTYECVTLIEVLEHISDEHLGEFVCNVARLVAENGHLLLSVPTVNVPLNEKHYRHYDLDLLETTIGSHFEIKRHWWLYRRGFLERWLRFVMVNRFYILNSAPLLNLIWRIHRRKIYFANDTTGAHLVALARLSG